ncbi:MAG: transposase [Stenomitos frigidus ULC029]
MNSIKLPQTLQEAIIFFSDSDVAHQFATQLRWIDGVTCPHCKCLRVGFINTRKIWEFKNKECRKPFSVKTGTLMEDSPPRL